jgi:hypothetical protein
VWEERERERERERAVFYDYIKHWVAIVLPNAWGSTAATQWFREAHVDEFLWLCNNCYATSALSDFFFLKKKSPIFKEM